jgi:xylulose-5-phosphate/fructose-6-phosphate phosphoketolase
MIDARTRHHLYVREHGEDMPEITGWSWSLA